MEQTYLRGRVPLTRRTGLLALGDLVALLTFAIASAARHGGGAAEVAETAAQFGVGWVLAAVVVGAYGPRAVTTWRRAAGVGAVAWAVGAIVGSLVRFATEPGAGLAPVFVLVVVGVGTVIFGGWRAIAAAVFGSE